MAWRVEGQVAVQGDLVDLVVVEDGGVVSWSPAYLEALVPALDPAGLTPTGPTVTGEAARFSSVSQRFVAVSLVEPPPDLPAVPPVPEGAVS